MRTPIVLIFTVLFLSLPAFGQLGADPARYVNPFIGTGGHGHTFPGATVPFGMVQLSPDTREDNWDGSSGYHYSDNVIWGFSHTHLSGTGIPDYCDVLFAPTIGEPEFFAKSGDLSENGYASTFKHENEKAEPGFYSVRLEEGNILAEMTATTRVGFHRYTFPATSEANLIVDLKHRDKVTGFELKIVGSTRIEGYRRSSSWARDQIVYFVAEFSQPFEAIKNENEEKQIALRFDTTEGKPVMVKVALSPTGITGARRNLQAELPHWNFDKVRTDARASWNKELSKIEVSGGTDAQMTNFYSALYHTAIQPNVFDDFDGSYRGLDKQIHSNPKSQITNPQSNYTVFSLWDTFRAAHPLYTIIDRKRTADFVNTFIRMYEQGGRLPVWELAGNETDTMIGYHAVSVIADAMAKGIGGFDYEKAFEAAKHSATLDHFGLKDYKRRGYISMEDEQESVSKTLEYAYNDYCIAVMARILKKPDDESNYLRRAQFYKNLFDRETRFMRPKQNGNWISPFAPGEVTFHFTEGNSWVYSFFVPQDVSGLMKLHGGAAPFADRLEELFATKEPLTGRVQPDITGLIGQYAHGNEPSHHIAYLFNYASRPWRTQFYIRKILDEFYKPEPDGLIGNEDCGQMSAWYILSALGFYPVNPSDPTYALGTPLFPSATIRLENGKLFTVRANDVSATNYYVQSVRLNGRPLRRSYITHNEINAGGTIEFTMGPKPNLKWFTAAPVSKINQESPAVPTIEAPRSFDGEATVKISRPDPNATVSYSIVDSGPLDEAPKLYTKPFKLNRSATIRAVAVFKDGSESIPVESVLTKMPHDWDVTLFSTYNRQYTGGGPKGLIDGIRGTTNFASGEWQGYQSQDFVAVIDLKRETEIRELGGGFLQVARSWIWMPVKVEFEISNDGVNFTKAAEIVTDVPAEDMEHRIRDYRAKIAPAKARYVRATARNLGKIPAWHPGAGFDAFIFVDEIFVD
ncbi:MAG: GH92 family glycosyl hydrolase [Acidobacteria bacterium]|nr:GH92 family glycosyl hydrolase [Acidobacteriota bacterium]